MRLPPASASIVWRGGTIVVEDRAGAAGSIGARACGEATPDGYTFCILPAEAMIINPVINPIAGFDPAKSLMPVTKVFYLTQVFAVTEQLKVKSFDELAALAKTKPKTLNYMSASLTKTAFVEEFNKKHGIDLVRVPFKGGGDAVNSMMNGTTPIAIFGIGNLMQFITGGQILGFAVDSTTRSPLAPNIPTFRQVGYTSHIIPSSFGIFAPIATPSTTVMTVARSPMNIDTRAPWTVRFSMSRPSSSAPKMWAALGWASAVALEVVTFSRRPTNSSGAIARVANTSRITRPTTPSVRAE